MKLCRFKIKGGDGESHVGRLEQNSVVDLTSHSPTISRLLENGHPATSGLSGPEIPLAQIEICCPVDRQEIWAAGVTYLRSKKARMEESEFSASAYDKVYEALRPEIFFKSMPDKAVGPGEKVGIRSDARWNVPEPELALVLDSKGQVAGYTICNDMSSRDIEGENLLYLPQAKIYKNSCAIGPVIITGVSEEAARQWTIQIKITRNSEPVFSGETSVSQIKRRFEELAGYLFRSQEFPNGAILSTGTGIVPADTFTLQANDQIEIDISGIGQLINRVEVV